MARSIRSNLVLWYGVTMAAALGGFGSALYFELRSSLLREADRDLVSRAATVRHKASKYAPQQLERELEPYFRDDAYYVLRGASGEILARSRRTPGEARERMEPGPDGTSILVGRILATERARLRSFLLWIAFAGSLALGIALVGTLLLTRKALAPVARVSAEAAASHRMESGQSPSELEQLVQTCNVNLDKLQEALERQTRFTSDASHELRTPLSILLTETELALKKERAAEEYRSALETILRAARRMKGVIDGLLTLARADAGQIPIRNETVALRPLVEETLRLLQPIAVGRSVALSSELADLSVPGDPERLRDVVTNLVINAVRYNREGGHVAIRLREESREAELSVADTGVGIPESDRPHIFDRFYRVDKARSREQGGTGLGLAITKWIVEAHRGTISFSSREGEGTTFTVRLPMRPSQFSP